MPQALVVFNTGMETHVLSYACRTKVCDLTRPHVTEVTSLINLSGLWFLEPWQLLPFVNG